MNQEQQWELYDVVADRTELHDLATEEPEVVKELSAAYERWAMTTGRRLPKRGVIADSPDKVTTTGPASSTE